ncbi:MAG: GntR family transcriptional regulator, partial [Tissierellia bacterium]|nr:GntR family transcriptional regulator [Tissierellia bacterium]
MDGEKYSTEQIYEIIKQRIIHLDYEPGEVLNEVELAKEFGISRTPVRRVFQLLQNDKLLNIIPRYGAQVTPIDFKDMKLVFELTRELDPFAVSLAVDRISQVELDELEEIMARFNT